MNPSLAVKPKKKPRTLAQLRALSIKQHVECWRSLGEATPLNPLCLRGSSHELADLQPSAIRIARLLAAKGVMVIHTTLAGEFASFSTARRRA